MAERLDAPLARSRFCGALARPRWIEWLGGTLPVRYGAVAQLVERFVRNEEVRGSIPLSSTV